MPLTLPAVLGRDAAGTVAAMGPGVTAFAVGDRVLGRVPGGGYAELVVAPVDAWAPVPATLDLADAGALPLVVLTGAQLAEEATDARAGETILVTGATGSVGRAAVFAAKARGAKVYAGVRAKHQAEAAKLGADAVVAIDDDGGDRQAAGARRDRRHRRRRDDAEAARQAQAGRQDRQRARRAGGRQGARLRGEGVPDALAIPSGSRELAQAVADGKLVDSDRPALPARRGGRRSRARREARRRQGAAAGLSGRF